MLRDKFNPLNHQGLPNRLINELRTRKELDGKIIKIFKHGGGVLNISEVLVGYYKLFNEIKSRQRVTQELYRLHKKGLLKPTKNKGEYKLA